MIIGVAKDMTTKNAFAANPANENPEPLLAVLNKSALRPQTIIKGELA